jgi:hypothetical protein
MTEGQTQDHQREQNTQIEDLQPDESKQDEIRGGLGQLNANRSNTGNYNGN